MKILSIIFLTIFMGNGCNSAKAQDMETTVIEYTANTRGFYQKITVKNQMLTVSKDRDGNDKPIPKKVSDADWKELVGCFKTVELDNLSKLKAITEKRFHDGAAIAKLKITLKEKAYETTSFDHGFPPKEIKKFVNMITSLAKK
ncbi:hypothetical protein [Flavobacterium sp. RSP15]|uniref:hypothetical protein n=1 Tax=Flavobacterium sp. RSP15 TaxID=2497485 RepID=UPI000F83E0A7|nr:hypothetical protein [Flavobacterium sp. RSP15]RTY88226.1 hypothetical protein EKM00_03485 [Flavobacterium sp. RSP15]